MESLSSRRNALMLTIGWWALRRQIRRHGTAAVSGLLAGEGLHFARPKRHRLRNLLLLSCLAAGGFVLWKRFGSRSRDDWGDWEPEAPATVSMDTAADAPAGVVAEPEAP